MLSRFVGRHPLVIVFVVLCVALAGGEARAEQLQRGICHASQRDHDAIERVIKAARNPPSRVGTVITRSQRRSLNVYADSLATAAGPRPSC